MEIYFQKKDRYQFQLHDLKKTVNDKASKNNFTEFPNND